MSPASRGRRFGFGRSSAETEAHPRARSGRRTSASTSTTAPRRCSPWCAPLGMIASWSGRSCCRPGPPGRPRRCRRSTWRLTRLRRQPPRRCATPDAGCHRRAVDVGRAHRGTHGDRLLAAFGPARTPAGSSTAQDRRRAQRRMRAPGEGVSSTRGSRDELRLRAEMVERQLRGRGIRDESVLAAMAMLPRDLFVPPDLAVARLWRRGPADRVRAIDKPAVHGRPNDRAAGAPAGHARPGGRDRLGLPGRRAGPARLRRRSRWSAMRSWLRLRAPGPREPGRASRLAAASGSWSATAVSAGDEEPRSKASS